MLALLTVVALSAIRVDFGKTSLHEYLLAHPWDAAKQGTLLVLDPSSVLPTGKSALTLPDFGRQEVSLGGVTAIVPTEMVVLDTDFKTPPNLYDGLPRQDKIMYLMSTLDTEQWKVATSQGIGFSDLRGEQQAVYKSILPSVFAFKNLELHPDGYLTKPRGEPEETVLTQEEESGVRIHFAKSISLGVALNGFNGISSGVGPQMTDLKKPGSRVYLLQDAPEDSSFLFGVQIRKVLRNKLKSSDLVYTSPKFDATIQLAQSKTIGDICHAVSEACGEKILADVRIRDLPVEEIGDRGRAGDVLKALALVVTGTYRQVGDVTLLTSDLEGIGTKRLKIEMWRSELDYQTEFRRFDMLAAIGAKGGLRYAKTSSNERMPTNEAMERFMDTDRETERATTMRVDDLPPIWRKFLLRDSHHFSGGHTLNTSVVEPLETMEWNFVTNDGRELESEFMRLGPKSVAQAMAGRKTYISNAVVKPISLATARSAALAYRTEDPEVAAALPSLARKYGFSEIWIQTSQTNCVSKAVEAAKAANVRVRVEIHPWEAPDGTPKSDLDRTLLGNTFSVAMAQHDSAGLWQNGPTVLGIGPMEIRDVLSPDSLTRPKLWTKYLGLAQVPGLDGVVICETQPYGYEPTCNLTFREESLRLDLGYDTEMRERFIAENSVDPVDFVDTRLRISTLDTTLPFFLNDLQALGYGTIDSSQPKGCFAQWLKLRSERNHRLIEDLAAQLPGTVLFQPRRTFQDMPRVNGYALVPWMSGSRLPTSNVVGFIQGDDMPATPDSYWLWQVGYPLQPAVASRLYDNVTKFLKRGGGSTAIDISNIPPGAVKEFMDAWFQVKE